MALLGEAAIVLSFDVAADAIAEHDAWHTHEHFPERMSIPGFLRGTRWVAEHGGPRYFVVYEVRELAILASAAYRERLDNPSPWTAKIMTHYRGMARGFCTIAESLGAGIGQAGLMVRFEPGAGSETELRTWLREELAPMAMKPGFTGAHVLKAALTPQSTNEQRIRGSDSPVAWVLLVTGYSVEAVTDVLRTRFREDEFKRRGAKGYAGGVYRMACSLSSLELSSPPSSQS